MELNLATMAHQPESMKTPKIITIDYPWLPIVYLLEPWLHFWMLGIVPFHLVFLFSLVLLSSSVPQLLSSSAPPLINSCTKQQATKRISQDNEIFIWKTSLMLFNCSHYILQFRLKRLGQANAHSFWNASRFTEVFASKVGASQRKPAKK